jgi:hypothetical protein
VQIRGTGKSTLGPGVVRVQAWKTGVRDMAMKKRVGKLLLNAGLISQGQYDAAVEIQEESGAELIDILFSLGAVEPNAFMEFLISYPGVLPSDIKDLEIDQDLLDLVPGDLARLFNVVPVDLYRDVLTPRCPRPAQY